MAALALRFRDARVRLLVADVAPERLRGGVREAPGPASFDAAVLIERTKLRWPAPVRPEAPRDATALAWLAGARGYRATVRTLRARAAAPRAAERSPGLVLVATAVRHPSLGPEAFDAHWRDVHGPLALRHHAGLAAYEQLIVKALLTPGAPRIDGVALLHFARVEDFRERFYDSPAGREAIHSDARRFLDLPRCEAAILGEHWARP